MTNNMARALAAGVALGALCLASSGASGGGGGHAHFGTHIGGAHFGSMHFGGTHFGGTHFGGMHFGGRHLGGVRLGHASLGHSFGRHAFSNHFAGHNRLGSHNSFANHLGGHHQLATHAALAHHNALNNRGLVQHGNLAHASTFNRTVSNNFTHHQNAFGDKGSWNSWNNHWGWNRGNRWAGCWGCGFWAGPVFWPYAFGDILTFAFWPYYWPYYYDPFWVYGIDFILASIFPPWPYWSYGYGPYAYDGIYDVYRDYGYGGYGGYPVDPPRHRHHPRSAATGYSSPKDSTASTNTVAQSCGGLAPGVTDLPVDRIDRAVHPAGDQRAALDDLKGASAKAAEVLKASCPSEVPLTPVSRLDQLEKRVDSMLQALQILRAPAENFYNSLTDEQKQRLDAMGSSTNADASRRNRGPMARGPASGGNLAQLCSERAERFTQLPVQRIEQTLKLTQQQEDALGELKTASANAGDMLKTSCPAQVPQSLVDRIDVMRQRLDSMMQAVRTVRPALDNFYASLNDEQKARFNMIGERNREAREH
jgi:hypothetical protein